MLTCERSTELGGSEGLGLLPGSLCVHYNNEPERRAAYLEAVADGMPGGYGLDDYAGLGKRAPGMQRVT